MTEYDRDTGEYIPVVAVSLVMPIRIQGASDKDEAEHDAIKAVKRSLTSKVAGLDISCGPWPEYPFVECSEPTGMEVELL